MFRKVSFPFSVIIFLLFFSSCTNIVGNRTAAFNFTLDKESTGNIIKTISAVEEINNESKIKIICQLFLGADKVVSEKKSEVLLKDLSATIFKMEEIPFETDYKVSIKVYFGDYLIYAAESDKFAINEENLDVKLKLELKAQQSKIIYNLNGGQFNEGEKQPESYFLNNDVVLPNPFKEGFKFEGWYITKDFSGDKITKLGKSKFLGDVTLYAKWSTFADVNNFSLTTGDKQITVAWENPTETYFDHAIISYGGQTVSVPKEQQSYVVNGLTNGTKYNIKIQASYIIDGVVKNSAGIEKGQYAMNQLTETPVKVDDIVKFGDFPQSYLADTSILTNDTVPVNGWTCYYGTDGYYYTKVTSTPFIDKDGLEKYHFNDNTTIKKDTEYYFRIEPIEWTIINTNYGDTGNKLLFCNKALRGLKFDASSNVYENSSMRKYLNGDFCKNAFTAEALTKISPTNIGYTENDTVFLLSETEIKTSSCSTVKGSSEYSRATGAAVGIDSTYLNNSQWWIRDPSTENRAKCYWVGGGQGEYDVTWDTLGVVPGLCVAPSVLP